MFTRLISIVTLYTLDSAAVSQADSTPSVSSTNHTEHSTTQEESEEEEEELMEKPIGKFLDVVTFIAFHHKTYAYLILYINDNLMVK